MPIYLIDTTVLIDIQRKREEAAEFVKKNEVVVSYVTILEILMGVQNKTDLRVVGRLLRDLPVSYGSEKGGVLAIDLLTQYRLKTGVGMYDVMIAATAIENNWVFVTDNIKHFRGIAGLKARTLAQVVK